MAAGKDNDAGDVIDDKMVAARERIDGLRKSAGGATTEAPAGAADIEKPAPERQGAGQEPPGDLARASRDLKRRIDDEKRRHAMPINASLGDPAIDAANADGHNDLPDEDDG